MKLKKDENLESRLKYLMLQTKWNILWDSNLQQLFLLRVFAKNLILSQTGQETLLQIMKQQYPYAIWQMDLHFSYIISNSVHA